MTLGSLFDGSGGFPLGALINGITPLWASEIEPFPIRVTTKRLPGMRHYGDVSKLNGAELPPVDIITFGSPCQDMSVAGRRAGLDGERSGLFHQAIRIVKEMRCATNGKYPRFIVWENVPGAFSSNDGEDFRCVLQAFCSICDDSVSVPRPVNGKWRKAGAVVGSDRSYAVGWRTLNAMYWGVPQRRERVFAVVSLTDQSAANLLFEREGVSGDSAESRRPWERFTRAAEAGIGATGVDLYNQCTTGGISKSLTSAATDADHVPCVLEETVALENHPADCEGGGKGSLIQSVVQEREE